MSFRWIVSVACAESSRRRALLVASAKGACECFVMHVMAESVAEPGINVKITPGSLILG
jgi:hypothetical protein